MAGALAFLMRDENVTASVKPRTWKPAATFAILQAVLIAAHVGHWVRG
jgi:hypothetical protein